MGGIYIKGMEMPQSCYACGFRTQEQIGEHDYAWLCTATGKRMESFNQKGNDCPLIEVPPHGRLIDADAIDFSNYIYDGDMVVGIRTNYEAKHLIDDAPTVIPADKDGET